MAIRLSETIYFVRDMDEAVQFYTKFVGFTLEKRYDWGFTILDVDGKGKVGLMLDTAWDREFPDADGLPKPRLALQTDDFEAEVHRLKSHRVDVGTINGEPGGRQSCTFFDHDENACFLWSDPEESMT